MSTKSAALHTLLLCFIAVMDLDPMRLIGMVRTWFEQHTQKHHSM
jgi:hypothetical protein